MIMYGRVDLVLMHLSARTCVYMCVFSNAFMLVRMIVCVCVFHCVCICVMFDCTHVRS
jgi:hypothetical protein